MNNRIKYISNSKRGLSRDRNQDRILIIDKDYYYFFALFDGVSSYPDSYKLIERFKKLIYTNIAALDKQGNNLDSFLYNLNKEVSNLDINGASTLSVLFISKDWDIVKYVNVGDTRVYMFNNQFLEQISSDDSLEVGSNIITKFLGSKSLTKEDFKPYSLENQYHYLLCTDGFYSLMENNLKNYFTTLNFKNLTNIKKKFSTLQRRENSDDSSYILVKNEFQD